MKSLLAGSVLASSVVVGVGLASPASALSCVMPSAVLDQAEAIYEGHVVSARDDRMTIEVDEVWRGEVPPPRVTYDVKLLQWWEPDQLADRGDRMVFVPVHGALNPCTVFALDGAGATDVRAFRPASPVSPAVAEPPRRPLDHVVGAVQVDHTWASVATGVGAGVLLAGALWWVRRRRRA